MKHESFRLSRPSKSDILSLVAGVVASTLGLIGHAVGVPAKESSWWWRAAIAIGVGLTVAWAVLSLLGSRANSKRGHSTQTRGGSQ